MLFVRTGSIDERFNAEVDQHEGKQQCERDSPQASAVTLAYGDACCDDHPDEARGADKCDRGHDRGHPGWVWELIDPEEERRVSCKQRVEHYS